MPMHYKTNNQPMKTITLLTGKLNKFSFNDKLKGSISMYNVEKSNELTV